MCTRERLVFKTDVGTPTIPLLSHNAAMVQLDPPSAVRFAGLRGRSTFHSLQAHSREGRLTEGLLPVCKQIACLQVEGLELLHKNRIAIVAVLHQPPIVEVPRVNLACPP